MTLAFPYYVHELSFVTFYGYTSQYLYSYFPDIIVMEQHTLWFISILVIHFLNMLCTYILFDY